MDKDLWKVVHREAETTSIYKCVMNEIRILNGSADLCVSFTAATTPKS